MKKFLFTLAALLMAGMAYATPDVNNPNYLYVPEFEITEDMLNEYNEVEIPVAAQVNYTAFAFQAEVMEIPEGMTFVDAYKGADYTITYKNNRGRDAQSTQELFICQPENNGYFGAQVEAGYWQAPGETAWTSYGAVKWIPGLYEEFVIMVFEVDLDAFKPGHIVLNSTWNGNDPNDPRNGIDWELWMDMPEIWSLQEGGEITLEGQVVPPVETPAPEIVVTPGDDAYIFDVVGPEGAVLTLYVDGVEVEIPYTVARTDVDQIVKLTATAHIDGQTDGSVYGEYLVPALVVVEPVDPSGEIIIGDPDENGVVTITYTGDEDDVTITVTVNGEEVALGEDGTITVAEGDSEITVTVGGEGYNDLTATKTVTYVAPVVPQPTPAPVITYVVNEEDVVITAEGEGVVTMYVDGVEVDNPYTIARGTTDVVVVVTATAQGEDMLISDVTTLEITIPAVGGVEPEDPHDAGVWAVFIDPNGQEHWYEMTPGYGEPTPYGCDLPLNKGIYGFPVDGVEPLVEFYLVVDGVNYGPEVYEALTEPEQFGDANMHELFEGDEHFAVPSGYWYSVGIITDRETGKKYLQISKGVFTSIEEMNAGKTVAGVRYYNLAGQEMQEANGMTIIVTSYTDGTTSVAKVMK